MNIRICNSCRHTPNRDEYAEMIYCWKLHDWIDVLSACKHYEELE
jgi:hypothetical protein